MRSAARCTTRPLATSTIEKKMRPPCASTSTIAWPPGRTLWGTSRSRGASAPRRSSAPGAPKTRTSPCWATRRTTSARLAAQSIMDSAPAQVAAGAARPRGLLEADDGVERGARPQEVARVAQLADLLGAAHPLFHAPQVGEDQVEPDAALLVEVFPAHRAEKLVRACHPFQRAVEGVHARRAHLRGREARAQPHQLLRAGEHLLRARYPREDGPVREDQVHRAGRVAAGDGDGAGQRHGGLRGLAGNGGALAARHLDDVELGHRVPLPHVGSTQRVEAQVVGQPAQHVPRFERVDDQGCLVRLLAIALRGLGPRHVALGPGRVLAVEAQGHGAAEEPQRAGSLAGVEGLAALVGERARLVAAASLPSGAGDGLGDGALRPARREGLRPRLGLVAAALVEEALRLRLHRRPLRRAALLDRGGEVDERGVRGAAALDLAHVGGGALHVAALQRAAREGDEDLGRGVAALRANEPQRALPLVDAPGGEREEQADLRAGPSPPSRPAPRAPAPRRRARGAPPAR